MTDFKRIIGSGLSLPDGDMSFYFIEEGGLAVDFPPYFVAPTLADEDFVWTKSSGDTFIGKVPASSNFGSAGGTYSVTCTDWTAVTGVYGYNFGQMFIGSTALRSRLVSLISWFEQQMGYYLQDLTNLPALTGLAIVEPSGVPGAQGLDISGSPLLTTVTVWGNNYSSATVDAIILQLVTNGLSNGTLDLTDNGAPSATGIAGINTLLGRGWNVSYDEP